MGEIKVLTVIATIIFISFVTWLLELPRWLSGEESACRCRRHGFNPWVRKIPWRGKWQPTPVCLLGNPLDRGAWQATVHGVTKESDMTKQLNNNILMNLHIFLLLICLLSV